MSYLSIAEAFGGDGDRLQQRDCVEDGETIICNTVKCFEEVQKRKNNIQ